MIAVMSTTDQLGVWQRLMSPECHGLLTQAKSADPYSTADVTALRRRWDKELVHAALALIQARGKAGKFGDAGPTLVADPQGVEMASSRAAASWKAHRFKTAGGTVLDLCCGVGGDTLAFARAGLEVIAADADPLRAWMAGTNTARIAPTSRWLCSTIEALHDSPDVPGRALFHIDPSRRVKDGSTSKRVWDLADVQPPPSVLRSVVDRWHDGAIKLAPGVDYGALAAAGLSGEVEIISERGHLTQAVLWNGALSRGDGVRTATLLRCAAGADAFPHDAIVLSGPADSAVPVWPGTEPPRYLYEVDDSVERAELLTVLCDATHTSMLHPRLGLIASDQPVDHPMLIGFDLLESAKWNEQRAAAVLRRLGAGSVEVKTRAKAVNPDQLQPALTKSACIKGGVPLVLFVLRFGSEARMLVARRH